MSRTQVTLTHKQQRRERTDGRRGLSAAFRGQRASFRGSQPATTVVLALPVPTSSLRPRLLARALTFKELARDGGPRARGGAFARLLCSRDAAAPADDNP